MRRPAGKPMEWLVKWKGYEVDRDAPSSWLVRRDFSTQSAYESLLAFERTRKRVQESARQSAQRQMSAAQEEGEDSHSEAGRDQDEGQPSSSSATTSQHHGHHPPHRQF